jgi:hypothetical protein
MDRHKILLILSKRIYRTAHAGRHAVEDMGVNHTGPLGPAAVMARAQGFLELIEEFRFMWRRMICRKDITHVPSRGDPMRWYDFQRHFCSGHSSAPKTFETYGRNLGTCDA